MSLRYLNVCFNLILLACLIRTLNSMFLSSFEEFQLYPVLNSNFQEYLLNQYGINLIFTNNSLFLLVTLSYFIFWIFLLYKENTQLLKVQQGIYTFFYSTIYSYLEKNSKDFFPMLMFFFLFYLFCKLNWNGSLRIYSD